ncbi:helix-turn-helix domain-containing protein [Pantoea stewartii]|uniref:helix-turn-helix transcriptional regulator n=1 Tax=Pantoea stewartii TaxID=66269 RepID=UPI0023F8BF90|nr:helix-turn-helix domain-containing protein [Pantoea stewartii]MDF7788601.1 helix-turn-helix domain-containing protein [Pantoea stewartii]
MDKVNQKLSFTEKEISVTWFYMSGMNMKQIAEWTGLPENSVSYYKRSVMRKIGVKNNNEFIKWLLKSETSQQDKRYKFSILK